MRVIQARLLGDSSKLSVELHLSAIEATWVRSDGTRVALGMSGSVYEIPIDASSYETERVK